MLRCLYFVCVSVCLEVMGRVCVVVCLSVNVVICVCFCRRERVFVDVVPVRCLVLCMRIVSSSYEAMYIVRFAKCRCTDAYLCVYQYGRVVLFDCPFR